MTARHSSPAPSAVDYVRSPMRARPLGSGPVDDTSEWQQSTTGLLVPPRPLAPCLRHGKPIAVELFAGAGGFGCGFKQAGIHVAAACELDVDAGLTYMTNLGAYPIRIHFLDDSDEDRFEQALKRNGATDDGERRPWVPRVSGSGWIASRPLDANGRPITGCEHFFLGDVRNLTGQMIFDALELGPDEIDIVAGGPPCQGFSRAGKQNVMDTRNSLVFEFTRLVSELRPRAFIMENVPGMVDMVTPEGIPVVDALASDLESRGYATRDAIRRALGATAGLGAVGRGQRQMNIKRHGHAGPDTGATPATEPQGTLFDQAAA